MSYIEFQKQELTNLEYALQREVIATDGGGGYLSSTMIGCNTRKYHGLLIAPIACRDYKRYVLLSSLDESVRYQDQIFNLGIHKYPKTYYPTGHKYLVKVEYNTHWKLTYQIGEITLCKELLLSKQKSGLLIRYTVEKAPDEFLMQLKPFLAYREIDMLSCANITISKRYRVVDSGVVFQPYPDLPDLYLQLNKSNTYVPFPDWYYKIEYDMERQRGYDYQEDLFVPGYFELSLRQGDCFVFSVSLDAQDPVVFASLFEDERSKLLQRSSFMNCLKIAADQFIIENDLGIDIIAGYPWFGIWGRDSFIALPGLTLCANRNIEQFKQIILSNAKQLRNGLLPNFGKDNAAQFNTVDASLWYIWSIQQYVRRTSDKEWVQKELIGIIEQIMTAYRMGINTHIGMHDNGLIWAKEEGKAFTWMDAIIDRVPVTQRGGYAVEINALWYNAIGFYRELLSNKEKDQEWEAIQIKMKQNFVNLFWDKTKGYLADYVDESGSNWDFRPNQILACSLPYSLIEGSESSRIMTRVRKELLTNKGIRTLSPKNENYIGYYEGNQKERDRAYHQGTAWPWMLQFYCEALYRQYDTHFNYFANELVMDFEEEMFTSGLGTINEIYDGNPPYRAAGAISQAWSVAALLYIKELWSHFNDI